jgi:hypothetical protein
MRRKSGSSQRELYARDCVIRAALGRMLAAQYDVTEPLSDRLEQLMKRLENQDQMDVVETRARAFRDRVAVKVSH